MELKTFVKVGNISNLSDARYCAGFGVNMLGFNLDTSDPDHISIETAKEIMGWVAVDQFVLECGNLNADVVTNLIKEFDIQFVQVNDADVANELSKQGIQVILSLLAESQEDIDTVKSILSTHSSSKYVLVESHNHDIVSELESAIKGVNLEVLRAFEIDADNAVQIADQAIYTGIALKGSVEEKAGFKDYDELADILEVLEVEN